MYSTKTFNRRSTRAELIPVIPGVSAHPAEETVAILLWDGSKNLRIVMKPYEAENLAEDLKQRASIARGD